MENIVNIASLSRTFKGSIKKLETAEANVREILGQLSRDTLAALHEHGNITFINSLIRAKMTPLNRKAVVLFFRAHSGFHYEEGANGEIGQFTKKQKTANAYEEKKAASLAALADKDWNLWVWAESNVEVDAKEWKPEAVTKYIESTLKKVSENGKYSGKYSRADIIAAIFEGGVTGDDISEAMQKLVNKEQAAA